MTKIIKLEEADTEVVNALFRSAIGGNVQAQIFWLTNRQVNGWNRKPEGEEQTTGVIIMPARGDCN
jgi:CTP synthase (UTP-ammonia lyase)